MNLGRSSEQTSPSIVVITACMNRRSLFVPNVTSGHTRTSSIVVASNKFFHQAGTDTIEVSRGILHTADIIA